ncbi:hypothetical protein HK405_014662, partial [Cladochytrium tenue]
MAANSAAVLVVVADGSEEMEAVIVIDVLRRAGNVDVVVAGLEGAGEVKCSRGVRIVPDTGLEDVAGDLSRFSCIVLPGGMGGARAFEKSARLHAVLARFEAEGRLIAAICAGR